MDKENLEYMYKRNVQELDCELLESQKIAQKLSSLGKRSREFTNAQMQLSDRAFNSYKKTQEHLCIKLVLDIFHELEKLSDNKSLDLRLSLRCANSKSHGYRFKAEFNDNWSAKGKKKIREIFKTLNFTCFFNVSDIDMGDEEQIKSKVKDITFNNKTNIMQICDVLSVENACIFEAFFLSSQVAQGAKLSKDVSKIYKI